MDMYFGWRSDINVGATHVSLGTLPNTSAQMEGPERGCHLVAHNQTGFGTTQSGYTLPENKRVSGYTVPGIGAET